MIYCYVDYDQIYDLPQYKLPVFQSVRTVSISQIRIIVFRPESLGLLISRYGSFESVHTVLLNDKKYKDKLATGDKFTEKDISEIKLALLIKMFGLLHDGDTVVFDSIRCIYPTYAKFTKLFLKYLHGNVNLTFLDQPYLNSLLYKPLKDSLNADIIDTFIQAQLKAVYQSLNIKEHKLAVNEDMMLRPGDGLKRKKEIKEYVIRNYHEKFAGYCNSRQIAEMLTGQYGFTSISAKTISRQVAEMLAEQEGKKR